MQRGRQDSAMSRSANYESSTNTGICVLKNRSVTRLFHRHWYQNHQWLTGSIQANSAQAVSTYNGTSVENMPVRAGFSDLRNFSCSAKMHRKPKDHVRAAVNLNLQFENRLLVDAGSCREVGSHFSLFALLLVRLLSVVYFTFVR